MVSERQVKELASKNKKLITNKVFFTSKTVNKYFQELAEIAIRKEIDRYNKIHMRPYSKKTSIKVRMSYDKKNGAVAYASSETINRNNEERITIFINIGNKMFEKVTQREKLLSYAKGLLAHEVSHIVNTDYRVLAAVMDNAKMGRIYPEIIEPEKRDTEFQLNYDKMVAYVEGPQKNRMAYASIAKNLHNCGEDGYIEEATMEVNRGSMIEGLYDLREFDFNGMPTIEEMMEKIELDDDDPEKMHIFNAILQVYLCYAKYGEFKYQEEEMLESEIVQAFIPCIKDLDRALACSDAKKRTQYMNNTMVILWPYIEDYLEYLDSLPEPEPGEGDGEGEGDGSGTSSKVSKHLKKHTKGGSSTNSGCSTSGIDNKSDEEDSEDSVSKKRKSTKSKLGVDDEEEEGAGEDEGEDESKSAGGDESEDEGEDESESEGESEGESDEDSADEAEDESEGEQDPEGGADGPPGDGKPNKVTAADNRNYDIDKVEDQCEEASSIDGGITWNRDYEGSNYDSAADDIERLLDELATGMAEEQLEKSRTEALNAFGKSINYGDKHRGMPIEVNRMSVVPERLVDMYNKIAPPLITISKLLQKKVSQKLQDRRKGGKETNLYFGHKLEARTLIRNDGRCFYRNKLPKNEPEMCVAVLLDESGSMSCGDRETYARATGLILYDFCTGLKIPVSVYGHTADVNRYGSLTMNSYAEFDSIDKKDRYRIMDSCARDNNRDGAALCYMYHMLDKRPENIKILFVISDGQPYASGYSGHSAEEDMRTMVETYRKRGVTTIAAAIGSDKAEIERIYGKEGFLDITDLNKLPVILTNILVRNLKL